jgi:hypothetical protein
MTKKQLSAFAFNVGKALTRRKAEQINRTKKVESKVKDERDSFQGVGQRKKENVHS